MRYLFLVLALILLAACGPAGSPEEIATADAPPPTPRSSGETITTASGLQYVILSTGTGPKAEPGNVVQVHYVGTLEDGTEFDNSYDRGQPFQFLLGAGGVIAGWDEGIALLHEGDKARLIIPAELGYGAQGAGSTIPPNSTLIFEVELVRILPKGPDSPTAVAEEDYVTTDSGLKYYDFEEGSGVAPQPGQVVVIQYTAWLDDGSKLASSFDEGQPLTFPVGTGQVFPGLDEGVASMKVGGKRQLVISPDLGFGEQGSGSIPPNTTITMEIELESVSDN